MRIVLRKLFFATHDRSLKVFGMVFILAAGWVFKTNIKKQITEYLEVLKQCRHEIFQFCFVSVEIKFHIYFSALNTEL